MLLPNKLKPGRHCGFVKCCGCGKLKAANMEGSMAFHEARARGWTNQIETPFCDSCRENEKVRERVEKEAQAWRERELRLHGRV